MTKRQANTLIGLAVAILITQLLCTSVLLQSQARMRSDASGQAAQVTVLTADKVRLESGTAGTTNATISADSGTSASQAVTTTPPSAEPAAMAPPSP